MIYSHTNGVKFGDYHTFNNWGLLLCKFPVIGAPNADTNIIDIPGADAPLDLSAAMDGYIHYTNRKLTFAFMCIADRSKWLIINSDIMTAIHGKRVKITIDSDPAYYYYGTVSVGNPNYNKNGSYTLTITADCDPYKYDICDSVSYNWDWDTFSFETGVIREYSNIVVNGTRDFVIIGSEKHVYPEFIVDSTNGAGITVNINGADYILEDGVNVIAGVPIGNNAYPVTFTGNGTVTIKFRGGRL